MAKLHIEYFSRALHRATSFDMLIPNDSPENASRPLSTLFLLHGYTGKAENWVPDGLPEKYGFAIVMPTAENSFYLNGEPTGTAYQAMVGEELVDYVRRTFHLANGPEDTCIAGLSMGGFGALHTGLMYPETFGGIMALSSALIIYQLAKMTPDMQNPMANYEYYVDTFGDLKKAAKSDHNPEVLYLRNRENNIENPKIFMACGKEDFLIKENRRMKNFLKKQNADFRYVEGHGVHDWNFWVPYSEQGIRYLLENEK